MPNIPQYTSKERVTTEPGISKLNVNPGAGEALERSGEMLSILGEKMRKIGNANATSDAALDRQRFEAEDTDKRSKLPTKDALTNIDNDVRKSREETANRNFSDPIGKQEWLRKQELLDSGYIIQTKADVYKRVVSERKVDTLRDLELEKSNYINAATEEEKLISVQKMEKIANDPANEDIYSAEDRKKLVDETVKDAQDAVKDIASLQRVKEKELKLAEEAAVNAREKELLQERRDAKTAREDLIRIAKQEAKNKKINQDFADRFINALKAPKAVKAKTIDKDFADIISEINLGTKKPDKIKSMILNAVSDGYLSETDYNTAITYYDMMYEKNPDDLVVMDTRKSWLGVEVFSENTKAKEESRSRMSRLFINKLQSGVPPQDAATEAMRQEVLYLHPEVMNYPEGAEYIDDSGRLKKLMPNGDILEIQSTKKDTRVKEKK